MLVLSRRILQYPGCCCEGQCCRECCRKESYDALGIVVKNCVVRWCCHKESCDTLVKNWVMDAEFCHREPCGSPRKNNQLKIQQGYMPTLGAAAKNLAGVPGSPGGKLGWGQATNPGCCCKNTWPHSPAPCGQHSGQQWNRLKGIIHSQCTVRPLRCTRSDSL